MFFVRKEFDWTGDTSCLVAVEERKTSDEVVTLVHTANEHLRVVTKQLEDGDHGKAAVLELLHLQLSELLRGLALALSVSEDQNSPVVHGPDEEEHLEPAEGRDGFDGGDSVRDGGKGEARSNLARESVHLRHDVSDDGELSDTAVLELSGSVLVELLLVDVLGESQGVEEADRGKDTRSILEAHLEGSGPAGAQASRGEGGDADEGGEDGNGLEHGEGNDELID